MIRAKTIQKLVVFARFSAVLGENSRKVGVFAQNICLCQCYLVSLHLNKTQLFRWKTLLEEMSKLKD